MEIETHPLEPFLPDEFIFEKKKKTQKRGVDGRRVFSPPQKKDGRWIFIIQT